MYETVRYHSALMAGISSITEFYEDQRRKAPKEFNLRHRMRPEVMFYGNRQPFYKLYPAIAEALITTKINIPVEEINFPFDSFVINLHKDLHIPAQGPSELCSMLVSSYKIAKRGHSTRVLVINYQTKTEISLADPAFFEAYSIDPDKCPSFNNNWIIDPDSYYLEFPLIKGQTLEQCYESYVTDKGSSSTNRSVLKIALGTIFLAISRDKKYVKREVKKIKANEQCICGSGKKYKKCCKLKGIQNVGYSIGRDIILAAEQKPGISTVVEGRGKELKYGHMRTGHMRWQWYNDEQGIRRRKLIFIHPMLVRPDLPMKPRLTPRALRRPKPKGDMRRYRKNPWRDVERRKYHRNPDVSLRDLERQYAVSPTEELRARLNIARNRVGLKLISSVCRVFVHGEEGWQVQSAHGEVVISTASASHDGWMGIDHAWYTDETEYPISLGSHISSRGYGRVLPKPTKQQVIQAHLEITGILDTGGDLRAVSHFLTTNRPVFPDGHECNFSMYDLSESPLREFIICHICDEPGRIYCDEHGLSTCEHHATFCTNPDCTNLECPQCAPKCGVCGQPACSYHIRECVCGVDACDNANVHCWDFCEDCGDRICKNHATIINDDWYCEEHTPRGNPARRPWLTGDIHRRIGALLELYRNRIAVAKEGMFFAERLEMPDDYEMLANKLGCLRATVVDWYGRGSGFVHSPSKRYAAAINTLYETEFL